MPIVQILGADLSLGVYGNFLVSIRPHLKINTSPGQKSLTAPCGILINSVDFCTERGNLLLESGAVSGGVSAVGRLECQSADPLVHIGHFVHGAFCGLGEGNAVLSVAVALIKAVDLGSETVGNLESGGIVLGAVNAETGGETLVGGVQSIGGVCHHPLSIQ